jgi:phosphoribosylaminoimidazolecarboxamide formyltransferase/IMP cyclohydrolase
MNKKRFSLISLYNKENIGEVCEEFKKNNIQIISTGSTAKHIIKIGYKCHQVSELTKFEEILNGRVKTLHPKIHASILFDREDKNHISKFRKLNFPVIDFVIVNLYPFEEMLKITSNYKKYIEMIDIGGSALLRSAAKNHNSITAICDTNDYKLLIKNLKKNCGKTSFIFRRKMAAKVFKKTSAYDHLIYSWINGKIDNNLKFYNHEKTILRYGENPHQKAFYYKNSFAEDLFIDNIIQGKKLSYNNILDINSAYECLCDFSDPTCVIIKHNNPCGVASNKSITNAFLNALSTDKKSAFGGIIALNREVDEKLATHIVSDFFEVVIAPKFNKKTKEIFKNKKKLILIEIKKIKKNKKLDIKSINSGYLVQQKNSVLFSKKNMKCVTKKKAYKKQIDDLVFSFKVCKHVKSNAIVLAKNKKTLGIGAGQMSRIDATKISLLKTLATNKKNGFVAASDAFFPFVDNIKLLLKNNCNAIIQPQGSINDNKIINFANNNNLPLYFSSYRFFKH